MNLILLQTQQVKPLFMPFILRGLSTQKISLLFSLFTLFSFVAQAQTASIKDVFVFTDNNSNKIYDAGDAPIAGVTVTLATATNPTFATAVTSAAGSYSFLNLAAGAYKQA